jgi:hypothetical protein
MKGGVVLLKRQVKESTLFKSAITLTFNTIATINNWPKEEAKQAVEYYFELIHDLKKGTTKNKKGGAGEIFYKFANWIYNGSKFVFNLTVGTFDTRCNTILALISIGTYSVLVYNKINQVPADVAQHSLVQPVQYIIYNVAPTFYNYENTVYVNTVNSSIIEYVSKILIPINIVTPELIVSNIRTLFYESTLYKRVFERTIVCILKHFIESCVKECQSRRLKIVENIISAKDTIHNYMKKPSVKSKSNSKGKSKSNSKGKTRSRSRSSGKGKSRSRSRSKSRSIYFTPKEE